LRARYDRDAHDDDADGPHHDDPANAAGSHDHDNNDAANAAGSHDDGDHVASVRVHRDELVPPDAHDDDGNHVNDEHVELRHHELLPSHSYDDHRDDAGHDSGNAHDDDLVRHDHDDPKRSGRDADESADEH
jgi:hypothetical protein